MPPEYTGLMNSGLIVIFGSLVAYFFASFKTQNVAALSTFTDKAEALGEDIKELKAAVEELRNVKSKAHDEMRRDWQVDIQNCENRLNSRMDRIERLIQWRGGKSDG